MNIIAILDQEEGDYRAQSIHELHETLTQQGFQLIYPRDPRDLLRLIALNARITGVVFDWDEHGLDLCTEIGLLNEHLPIYAFINTHSTLAVSISHMHREVHFFEYGLGLSNDISKRIQQHTGEYIASIMPPLTKALFKYVQEAKYTFCTPGHVGGSAYLKSPMGCLFYDFFGANALKADVSVSVTELGSLLDHSGPHREAEEYIAQTFNAERSYMVTNGTSTANKIVSIYSAPAGSTVLVDRNCHKSLTHWLMMSDVTPIYLHPMRNSYGILGGIPQHEFDHQSIAAKVARTDGATWPRHAVITNSTYDGLLYNTDYIKQQLEVASIHFDSAWVPYTNFHPIYGGKSGMSGAAIEGKVLYETQSTHKLLAAFSQASMIHIKGEYNENTLNEAYMMHTSTSPNYGIVASIESAAAMMRGRAGYRLINRAIERALHFRREICRLAEESEGWFYDVWQPEDIDEMACWPLRAEESWHGFSNVAADHLYLDPIKVTLLTPGIGRDGQLVAEGIPAALVAHYLDQRGIIVEKTGPYNLLFLFSIGINKTHSLSLLRALTDFKRDFDSDRRVKAVLPNIYALAPEFYEKMTLKELARGIHQLAYNDQLAEAMQQAFSVIPKMVMTPYQMFQQELAGNVATCALEELVGKVNANMILPYPPGIPLIMPGEMITEDDRPLLDYLLMLCTIGSHYPGFGTSIHGVIQTEQGHYCATVLKE